MTWALVLIDLQEAFIGSKGMMRPSSLEPVTKIGELVQIARSQQMPVFWTRSHHEFETDSRAYRILHPGHFDTNGEPLLRRDSRMFHIASEFLSLINPGDCIVDKTGFDAFYQTNLDHQLRSSGIDSLLLAGVMTNVCVIFTAAGALQRGYLPVVVKDATAAIQDEAHDSAIRDIKAVFGLAVRTDEVVELLGKS